MSLSVDSIFIRALSSNKAVMKSVGGRIYGQDIAVPDAEYLNVPVPYVIVHFAGLTNDSETKDDDSEGAEDVVTVEVFFTAPTNAELHTLAECIRKVIRDFVCHPADDDPERQEFPVDYDFSAGSMEYDATKECYYQLFTYRCTTNR